ncbi:hypothetical protein PTUN_a3204 [Pseudoalteromonas tunicata]|nr:hypothetical protein PTUN_a3204 [Pseudoalteromonas tunicata]
MLVGGVGLLGKVIEIITQDQFCLLRREFTGQGKSYKEFIHY